MTLLYILLLQFSICSNPSISSDLILGKWEVISFGMGDKYEEPQDLYVSFFKDGTCHFEYEKEILDTPKWTIIGDKMTIYMEEETDVFKIKFDKDLMYWDQNNEITTLKRVK